MTRFRVIIFSVISACLAVPDILFFKLILPSIPWHIGNLNCDPSVSSSRPLVVDENGYMLP